MTALENKIREEAQKCEGMPVALSGGVDSSLLTAIIRPKFAISVRLPGDEKYDEIQHSSLVAQHLGIQHIIVDLDESRFDESVTEAVKAIGRPIPHFNIFPLFEMYKKLAEMGEKHLVLGDGPDETMCGYGRDLIINYLYKVYNFEAFKNYKPLLDKLLPSPEKAVSIVTGKLVNSEGLSALDTIIKVDIEQMRPDMDDMSNLIAKHFGITNHRPYQDNPELDSFMRDLPIEQKVKDVEFGKYALREIAAKYLPKEIAWRKKKVGGPVYPVNIKKGWVDTDGEFGKSKWLEFQLDILNGGQTVGNNNSI